MIRLNKKQVLMYKTFMDSCKGFLASKYLGDNVVHGKTSKPNFNCVNN